MKSERSVIRDAERLAERFVARGDCRLMHVLVLPSFYPTDLHPNGGMFFKDQVMALQRHGLRVGVAYANARSLRRGITLPALLSHHFQPVTAEEDGIPTVRVMSWNMLGQFTAGGLLNGSMITRAAHHYIRTYGKPDIVHAHQARWAGRSALHIAREFGIPFVITEHESCFAEGNIPDAHKPYLREIFDGAEHVIAVSHAMADAMHDVYDPAKVDIIPNMVDTDYFTPGTAERPVDPFTFLCVARLAQVKCIDQLITAFHHAFPDDRRTRLRLVGGGPEADALARLVAELHLEDRVDFCGEMPHDQVREEMRQANVFVLSSDTETFGVVLIEAIATGMPVIATQCGGPDDIVTDEVGLLTGCRDVEGLAQAMRQMRDSYSQYASSTLHALAAQRFGEQAIAARLHEVYARVCARHRP